MARLKLKDILNIPELSFYIQPEEFAFFIKNNRDYETLANLYNTSRVDAMMNLMSGLTKKADKLEEMASLDDESLLKLGEGGAFDILSLLQGEGGISEKSDSLVTRSHADEMKRLLLEKESKVGTDNLMLYLGGLASKYLKDIDNKEKNIEINYTNGDIIVRNGDSFIKKSEENGIEIISESEIKGSLIKGMLIANKQLADSLKRNPNMNISGMYYGRGSNPKKERVSFSLKELNAMSKNENILRGLSVDTIREIINERLVGQNSVLRAATKGIISREDTLELMNEGVLKKEEVARKVFGVNNINDVMKSEKETIETKLMLYSLGISNIHALETNSSTSKDRDEKQISPEFFERISKYFDKKKIGELLTHNVLSYVESKRFLDSLTSQKVISSEENKYFENVMNDFKCNELLNTVETEAIGGSGDGDRRPRHVTGLTIDPGLRMEYFRSIGAVKRVKIKGESLIDDGDTAKKKKNSLDGYELLIIPDKKIAILEKFYEVSRDKVGNLEYRKDKNGSLIPSIENATYILPIGLAKDLAENRNKKELMSTPSVRRAFHTMDWSNTVEKKMQKINSEIEFSKENTEKWKEKIAKNYRKNKAIEEK